MGWNETARQYAGQLDGADNAERIRMVKTLSIFLIIALLSGCVWSPGSPWVSYTNSQAPNGSEEVVRGVVNGIYEYDPERTSMSMAKLDEHLLPEDIENYSRRYIVRIGIDRAPPIVVVSPIYFGFRFSDYVVLPDGWSHNLSSISDDPETINIGDVVDISIQSGRYFDFAISVVRQCFEPPWEDENPDWNIGCKTYEGFNDDGYAGEKYFFRPF